MPDSRAPSKRCIAGAPRGGARQRRPQVSCAMLQSINSQAWRGDCPWIAIQSPGSPHDRHCEGQLGEPKCDREKRGAMGTYVLREPAMRGLRALTIGLAASALLISNAMAADLGKGPRRANSDTTPPGPFSWTASSRHAFGLRGPTSTGRRRFNGSTAARRGRRRPSASTTGRRPTCLRRRSRMSGSFIDGGNALLRTHVNWRLGCAAAWGGDGVRQPHPVLFTRRRLGRHRILLARQFSPKRTSVGRRRRLRARAQPKLTARVGTLLHFDT